jgi:hypothetical protein
MLDTNIDQGYRAPLSAAEYMNERDSARAYPVNWNAERQMSDSLTVQHDGYHDYLVPAQTSICVCNNHQSRSAFDSNSDAIQDYMTPYSTVS